MSASGFSWGHGGGSQQGAYPVGPLRSAGYLKDPHANQHAGNKQDGGYCTCTQAGQARPRAKAAQSPACAKKGGPSDKTPVDGSLGRYFYFHARGGRRLPGTFAFDDGKNWGVDRDGAGHDKGQRWLPVAPDI